MLEMMICSSILLISVLAAARAQLDANRLLTQARQTNIAVGVAQAALDVVLETELDELLAGAADLAIGEEIPVDTNLLANQEIRLLTPGYDPAVDLAPEALEVCAVLTWRSVSGHDRTLTLAGVLR